MIPRKGNSGPTAREMTASQPRGFIFEGGQWLLQPTPWCFGVTVVLLRTQQSGEPRSEKVLIPEAKNLCSLGRAG